MGEGAGGRAPASSPKISCQATGSERRGLDGLDCGNHLFQALFPGLALGLFQVHRGGEAREAAQERPEGVFQAGLLLLEPLVDQGEEKLEFQALPIIQKLHLDLFMEPILQRDEGSLQLPLESASGLNLFPQAQALFDGFPGPAQETQAGAHPDLPGKTPAGRRLQTPAGASPDPGAG